MLVRAWREGVGICFCVGRVWKVHVGVKRSFFRRCEGKTVVNGRVDVLENV